MNSIGNKIKSLRSASGLTAQELGYIVGRSKSNISGYENGKYEPSAQTIIALCKHFNVSADWLLDVQISEQNLQFQLSEAEQDLCVMFRCLESNDQEDVFQLAQLKYNRKQCLKKELASSTYSKSDPDSDENIANGIA